MGVVSRDEQLTLEGLTERLLVAVLSDIHISTKKSEKRLREAIDCINSRDVDLVFLLGDYVTNTTRDISPLAMLAGLESRYGVYAVLGNHDYRMAFWNSRPNPELAETLHNVLEVINITVLRNDSSVVDAGGSLLNVLGLDNHWYNADVDKTFSAINPFYPTILLAHDPDAVAVLGDEHTTDLVLSGHTHGYMVRFPSGGHVVPYIPTKLGREYDQGFKEYEGRLMYITSGLGAVSVVPRILNPPEVVFLELLPVEDVLGIRTRRVP